jgi:hypothetical protein
VEGCDKSYHRNKELEPWVYFRKNLRSILTR